MVETDYDNNRQCFKCKSREITVEEIKNAECSCGALNHFRKICRKCGFISFIHRTIGIMEDALRIGG